MKTFFKYTIASPIIIGGWWFYYTEYMNSGHPTNVIMFGPGVVGYRCGMPHKAYLVVIIILVVYCDNSDMPITIVQRAAVLSNGDLCGHWGIFVSPTMKPSVHAHHLEPLTAYIPAVPHYQ